MSTRAANHPTTLNGRGATTRIHRAHWHHDRGDLTYAGGNLTQHYHGASMPPIELDLGMKAEPLFRLFHDDELIDRWLSQRKEHLVETQVPKPQSSVSEPQSSFPDVTGMYFESRR